MSHLPISMNNALRGNILWTGLPARNYGFSMVGTKTVVLTDAPGIYVHDTGGIFGNEVVVSLEGADAIRQGIPAGVNWQTPVQVNFNVLLNSQQSVFLELYQDTAFQVESLFLSSIFFPQSNYSFDSTYLYAAYFQSQVPVQQESGSTVMEDSTVAFHHCRVVIDGHRVYLMDTMNTNPGVIEQSSIVDLPLQHIQCIQQDSFVYLNGATVFQDMELTHIIVDFASSEKAAHFLSEAQKFAGQQSVQEGKQGELGQVVVDGVLKERIIRGLSCDMILGDVSIELYNSKDGSLLHSISLLQPNLTLDGTVEKFNISDAPDCLLSIQSNSSLFQEKLLGHQRINQAAVDATRQGPFLVESIPVNDPAKSTSLLLRIESVGDRIHLFGMGSPRTLYVRDVQNLALRTLEDKFVLLLELGSEKLTLQAQHNMLEGLARAIRTAQMTPHWQNEANSKALFNRAVTLEGEFLSYELFGLLVDFHLSLLKTVEAPKALSGRGHVKEQGDEIPLMVPLPLPQSEDGCSQLIVSLAQGITAIKHYVEECIFFFPKHLISNDEAVLSEMGGVPPSLTEQEVRYERVLSPLHQVMGYLVKMEGGLTKLSSVQSALQKQSSGWGATALSLGASAIAPVFLVSAAASAVRSFDLSSSREKTEREAVNKTCFETVELWNRLVFTLLPPIAYRILRGLYPMRVQVAKTLHSRMGNLPSKEMCQLVSKRVATLETYLQFPNHPVSQEPRVSAVRELQALMEATKTNHFTSF